MSTRDAPISGHPTPARAERDAAVVPWILEGIAAGAVGAAVIAVFYLVVDLILGRPLWTPFALGSVFFLGAFPAPGALVVPALVGGWTFIHGAVFAGLGAVAAFEVFTGSRIPGGRPATRALVLAALLFVVLEAVFLGFGLIMAREVLGELGFGRVALANLLAAIAMATMLVVRAERRSVAAR